ncbi:MAG: lysylphosphatidylglycerol synthase transmembrane domain-containing protein [Candidatus Altiarchaeota archaeon]
MAGRRWNAVSLVIGILLLAFIILAFNPREVYSVLSRVDLIYFVLAALCYFATDLSGSLVLMNLLKKDSKLGFRDFVSSHMCGLLYSVPTPGRVGYYYTAYSLSKKLGSSISANMGVLTFVQGIYLSLRAFLCLLATIYFSLILTGATYRTLFIVVSLFPLSLVAFIVLALFSDIPHRLFGSVPVINKGLVYIKNMQEAARDIPLKKIYATVALGLFGWFTLGLQWFFLSKALGLSLTYLDCLMLFQLVTALLFVPLPSGLGVTEGGSAVAFTILGLAASEGVAFMLLVRVNMLSVDLFGLLDLKAVKKLSKKD